VDLERLFGDLTDAVGDGPTVFGLEGEDAEDEKVEGALDELGGLHGASFARLLKIIKGKEFDRR
jgi:hypothetical protein